MQRCKKVFFFVPFFILIRCKGGNTVSVEESFELKCGLVLRNRLFFAPISTLSCHLGGEISEEDLEFYDMRSSSVGAVVLASAYVSQKGKAYEGGIGISHNRHIPGLNKLVRTIKKQGAKAIVQVYHGGAMTLYNRDIRKSFCVSKGSQNLNPTHLYDELTLVTIEQIYQEYEEAVVRAISSGFDGVEIHAASNYLPFQFMSPNWNHREDSYGGDLKGRLKFTKELISRLKRCIDKHTSSPFALGIRLSEVDTSLEAEEQDQSFKTTLLTIQELNDLPLDYIHMASSDCLEEVQLEGRTYSKSSLLTTMSQSVPLIMCGGLLKKADVVAALAHSPLISACRPFIFLPNWAGDILTGAKEIVIEERALTGAVRQELRVPRVLWKSVKESKDWYMYK